MDGLQIGLPIGLILFLITVVMVTKDKLSKRPTFKEVEDTYKQTKLCDEIHKTVDEKLQCLPEIKTTVTEIKTTLDIFIKTNGK